MTSPSPSQANPYPHFCGRQSAAGWRPGPGGRTTRGGNTMADAVLLDWAANALASAAVGEARRTARLVTLAGALGAGPTAARPEACQGRARRTAAYRRFDTAAVPPDAVLARQLRAA